METEKRLALIESIAEEIVTREELVQMLDSGKQLKAYDGFEPSGLAHLPFAVYRTITIQKLMDAGIDFTLYLADYFAFVNNKFDGNMETIHACGEYFVEVWKAAGIPVKKLNVVWASELMDSLKYWDTVLNIARNLSNKRNLRAMLVAGREEAEELTVAQQFYPSMQVADIFMLDVDICQLGLDQRRANILARELAPKFGRKKPVAVHHHMLLGLQGLKEEDAIKAKMSKSKPESSIFVHDSKEEIEKKVMDAYCLAGVAENNPLLEYSKYLVFEKFKEMKVERPAKFGGPVSFASYQELENAFKAKELHPLDLKKSVAFYIDEIVSPIRSHFEKDAKAAEMLKRIKEAGKTS
ncbi:MAG: tyrosine--tRNA ligase [Candidatus Diapherotrites archaeon]|nr:tyrosine--tRNA ligase [Candidatus Diapherotrites archaeon]